ncbi:unnamed protein product [Heligmosomoides polygyrus]|uniref:Secreted protein n=1 Tax=Heligmosomoides polygyrus TaxID=6339 RepID=A0A183F3N2_HELPZ|nr:unnamed protein product [Heligmosomoides polygyrus]
MWTLLTSWSQDIVEQVESASSVLDGVEGSGTLGDLADDIESLVPLIVLLIGRNLAAGIEPGGVEPRRLGSKEVVISASCCAFIRSWVELERRNVSIICKQNV